MLRVLLITISLFYTCVVSAQNNNFLNELNSIDTTNSTSAQREALYLKADSIITDYENLGDENDVLKYLETLFRFSQSNKDTEHVLNYGIKISKKYSLAGLHNEALAVLSSINDNSELENHQRHKLYKAFSDAYLYTDDWETACRYLDFQLSMIEKEEIEKRVSILQNKADILNQFSRYNLSLTVYDEITRILISQDGFDRKYRLLNNIGFIHNQKGDRNKALRYFREAEKNAKSVDATDLSVIRYNLGIALSSSNLFADANKLFKKINKNAQPTDSIYPFVELALIQNYLKTEDLFRADDRIRKLIEWADEYNRPEILETVYMQAALVQGELNDFENALSFYNKHLSIKDSLDYLKTEELRAVDNIRKELQLTKSEIEYLKVDKELQEALIKELDLEKEALSLSNEKKEQELALTKRKKELELEKIRVSELDAIRIKNELELANEKLLLDRKQQEYVLFQKLKEIELDSLEDEKKQIEQNRQLLEQQNAITELELSNKEKEIAQQKEFKRSVTIISILGLLLLLTALGGVLKLRQSNKIINQERQRSDDLLTAILPEETAEELKTSGKALPKSYDSTTVMFTDFTGFSKISKGWPPEDIIKELEICFQTFDDITEKYNLERIKTIGDSYMCAGGLPIPNKTHIDDTIKAAIAMQEWIISRKEEKKQQGLDYWGMKVGIHTGPVVAGVVGNKKFAYDIWGDTVNIASRLEQMAEEGTINISKSTKDGYNLSMSCKDRGIINTKGVGDIQMYTIDLNS